MPTNVPHPQAVLRGHRGEVQALEFDGSEGFLVSGDSLGEVRVWDLGDLRPASIRRLHPLSGGILSLRLFRSGGQQLLGTQGRDGITLLWACGDDLQLSEQPVRSFQRECYSFCRFAVLQGETPPAASSSGSLPAQGQHQGQHHRQEEAEEFLAAVLDDEQLLAEDGQKRQQRQQQQQEPAEEQEPAELRASPQGAASPPASPLGCASMGAAIWALHPCSQASEEHPPALLAIPGGDERTAEVVCASCGARVAEFREEAAGRKLGMLMAVQLYCSAAAGAVQAPAGTAAAPPPRICLAAGYEDGSVVVWQLGAGAQAPPLTHRQLCTEPVMALAIEAGGGGGACGAAEEQVVCFKIDHAARRISVRHSIALQKGRGVGDVAVRPDRKLLATAGWDGRVRVYKYRSGRPLAILKYHTSPVTGIQFAPRSMLLATAARDGTLALWPLFQPEDA